MVKQYIIRKEIKKIGNSHGFTFSIEEKKVWKIKNGDIIGFTIIEIIPSEKKE